MRHLLAFALLSVASGLSTSAHAEKAEAAKEESAAPPAGEAERDRAAASPDAGVKDARAEAKDAEVKSAPGEAKDEHAEAKGDREEAKGEHEEANGDREEKGSEGGEEAEEKAPTFVASVDTVLGWGNLPDDGESAVTGSFMFGGWYSILPQLNLGARFPITVGSVKEADDSNAAVAAGNLEIAAELGLPVGHGFRILLELGSALPTASGDEFDTAHELSVRRAALNEAAAAARGGLDNALFAAHRFGLIPLVGFEYERGPVEVAFFTKMEILIKAGGVTPPDPIEQHSVAAESVTRASFYYWVVDERFAVGLRAWFTAAIVEESEDPDEAEQSKVQFVVEPGIKARLGVFSPALSYVAPVGGPLGDRGVGGLHVTVGVAF